MKKIALIYMIFLAANAPLIEESQMQENQCAVIRIWEPGINLPVVPHYANQAIGIATRMATGGIISPNVGHTSVEIITPGILWGTNNQYNSFWPGREGKKNTWIKSLAEDEIEEAKKRIQTQEGIFVLPKSPDTIIKLYSLNTTNMQAKAFDIWWQNPEYDFISCNCCSVVLDILRAGGLDKLLTGWRDPSTEPGIPSPGHVKSIVEAAKSKEKTKFITTSRLQ